MSLSTDKDIILLSDAKNCRWFLQQESTIKVIMCKQNGCGWCTKFEPVFRQVAPPINYDQQSPTAYPLFAMIDSQHLLDLETRWFQEAIATKEMPADTKFIKGGNPKFIILSGMKHKFAEKNQLIGCSVGHMEEIPFLSRIEMAAPGILDTTTTFAYLKKEVLQKAKSNAQTDIAAQTMAKRSLQQTLSSRAGGGGGGGNGSGGDGECNDPNCPNPHCPRKLKLGGGNHGCQDPDCKHPECPNYKKKTLSQSLSSSSLSTTNPKWDRKYRHGGKPTTQTSTTTTANTTTYTSGIPPPRVVKYGGNKTSFYTYDNETGLHTYWEHRYPPQVEGEGKQLNETVTQLVKIMRKDHQIPWNSVPDPTVSTVRLSFQTRFQGNQNVYQPSYYEGIDAVNWGAAYLRSLDAMARRTHNNSGGTSHSEGQEVNQHSSNNLERQLFVSSSS